MVTAVVSVLRYHARNCESRTHDMGVILFVHIDLRIPILHGNFILINLNMKSPCANCVISNALALRLLYM